MLAQIPSIRLDHRRFVGEPSIIVFKEGDIVYALNARTKAMIASGDDDSTVIQKALDSLTPGRTWKEKVIMKGSFNLSKRIVVPSYTHIEICGEINLKPRMDIPQAFYLNGDHISIRGGVINGNSANQANETQGIRSKDGVSDIVIEDVKIAGFYVGAVPACIFISRGTDVWIERCILEDYIFGIYFAGGPDAQNWGIHVNFNKGRGRPTSEAFVNTFYGTRLYDFEIIGNDFDNCLGGGEVMDVENSWRGIIAFNKCKNSKYGDGILIGSSEPGFTSAAIDIIGNVCSYNGRHGIHLNALNGYLRQINVIGNICFDNNMLNGNYDGIHICGLVDGIIALNRCYDDRATRLQRYGIAEDPSLYTNENIIIGNIVTLNVAGGIYKAGADTVVLHNLGHDTGNFKAINVSVPVGTGGAYGNVVAITSPSGRITLPRVKITWGGTFGANETVIVKVEAVYSDNSTAYVEKSATAAGSVWLTDDDIMALIAQDKDISRLNIYAKSSASSTSVTVTIDAYGKA